MGICGSEMWHNEEEGEGAMNTGAEEEEEEEMGAVGGWRMESEAGARADEEGERDPELAADRRDELHRGNTSLKTQASPVRATSVAHCLSNHFTHASHPLLPPPPRCLRASATAA